MNTQTRRSFLVRPLAAGAAWSALTGCSNKPSNVPGEEGLRDIRIVRAIIAAAQSGKSVEI